MSEYLKGMITAAAWFCSCATTIAAAAVLIIKPARKKARDNKAEDEGVKCLLRSDMLRTYYAYKDTGKIRQFEYENFIMIYNAYKAMGGNSFIDHIKAEIEDWEVVAS